MQLVCVAFSLSLLVAVVLPTLSPGYIRTYAQKPRELLYSRESGIALYCTVVERPLTLGGQLNRAAASIRGQQLW